MNDCFGAVWSNLGTFLGALKGLSASEAMDLAPEGGFCLSTRSQSASENWVWLPPDLVTPERAEAALRFLGACPSCGRCPATAGRRKRCVAWG